MDCNGMLWSSTYSSSDIAARYRIAHDHQIGPRLQVGLAEGLGHRNIQRSQEV